ncbi:hypothetical protein SNEBB_011334 [Seison nebaliae]|nr:hypothetical protein SNEBB_011334 [Seison nebaliae]
MNENIPPVDRYHLPQISQGVFKILWFSRKKLETIPEKEELLSFNKTVLQNYNTRSWLDIFITTNCNWKIKRRKKQRITPAYNGDKTRKECFINYPNIFPNKFYFY